MGLDIVVQGVVEYKWSNLPGPIDRFVKNGIPSGETRIGPGRTRIGDGGWTGTG